MIVPLPPKSLLHSSRILHIDLHVCLGAAPVASVVALGGRESAGICHGGSDSESEEVEDGSESEIAEGEADCASSVIEMFSFLHHDSARSLMSSLVDSALQFNNIWARKPGHVS